ncbi:hypothetical protein ASPBRDRAFT_120888 [Aspergillus brasiliensis CBS 101740]|uniref:Aminoglycoside phosphotransferase domain-containing protein n=1 Tax=Aspergillus brasiliensis (strain CBS 101740 / IMI 381727 / IBT 21946) TaxID=767769 RepID=A0A1L9UNA9_ASPBC|nr:hypothetical protein ASPBRDRAFT_120888 [Aspergillus brasiliensis CBS 101740]
MKQTYNLHGVGKIRHMLVMGWAGNHVDKEAYEQEVYMNCHRRAVNAVLKLGVLHENLGPRNMLWNEELGRLMVIDFHRCRFHLNHVYEKPEWLTTTDAIDWETRNDNHREHCSFHRTCVHPLTRKCPNEKHDVC